MIYTLLRNITTNLKITYLTKKQKKLIKRRQYLLKNKYFKLFLFLKNIFNIM